LSIAFRYKGHLSVVDRVFSLSCVLYWQVLHYILKKFTFHLIIRRWFSTLCCLWLCYGNRTT